MGNEQRDINQEQKRINEVIVEIDHILDRLHLLGKGVQTDSLELRKTFWEDVTVNLDEPDDVIETFTSIKQQAELLAERERSHGQINKQVKTLFKLKNSPYFGRIDFLEDGEEKVESVYLGISSLMDQKEENFLIYDWRAPISSLYYDFPPGPAFYETPEGTITGEMKLKRQFIIRNGKIISLFDTGITIGDELLLEVLGHNASTQMKSIVATIQKEQNQIIRNEKSKLLVVQGVAGSGKTSAALQRVAYLLYRNRQTLSSENIMLFSPNPLFNSYVSTVLPELGEENMKQTTFQEYLYHQLGSQFAVEDAFTQLEFLLNKEETANYKNRMTAIRFKGSQLFKEYMDQMIASFHLGGLYFKDIFFRNKLIVSKMDILYQFYQLDTAISLPNRIQIVKDWIIKQLKRQAKKEQKEVWVEEAIQFLEKEDYLEAYKAYRNKQNDSISFDDFEKEQKFLVKQVVNKEMKPIIRSVKRLEFIDLRKIYAQLFIEKQKVSFHLPEKWPEICRLSLGKLRNNILPYEDATPFLYLKEKIEGRKVNLSIRHVFIDEAQDYSPFQFAYLKELFPYAKMTLLGDMNQAIFLHSKDIKSIFQLEDESEKETIILRKSYRSTKQIVEFTRGLVIDGDKIEPFNREGEKPTLTIVTNELDLKNKVLKRIHMLQCIGYQTIAVIGKTASETKKAFQVFADEINAHLMEKGTSHYEKGIVFIPAYLAKGIEFDAVIMLNASQQSYGREMEKELFYTACTRAMHELHLFSLGAESMFINRQPRETYDVFEEAKLNE